MVEEAVAGTLAAWRGDQVVVVVRILPLEAVRELVGKVIMVVLLALYWVVVAVVELVLLV